MFERVTITFLGCRGQRLRSPDGRSDDCFAMMMVLAAVPVRLAAAACTTGRAKRQRCAPRLRPLPLRLLERHTLHSRRGRRKRQKLPPRRGIRRQGWMRCRLARGVIELRYPSRCNITHSGPLQQHTTAPILARYNSTHSGPSQQPKFWPVTTAPILARYNSTLSGPLQQHTF